MTDSLRIGLELAEGASAPEYMTEGAAGADVRALLPEKVVIAPMGRALIPTGIFMEIPEGFEIQVRPRSGLALKYGVTVLNSPGTIDSDYRGELKVLLANFGESDFTVNSGDRIAQLVAARAHRAQFVPCAKVAGSGRGEDGFGSTGV